MGLQKLLLTLTSKLVSGIKILPLSIIKVEIQEVFLHCSKAFIRSALWDPESIQPRSILPSMGEMLKDQTGDRGKIESQQEMELRYSNTLY